MNKLKKGIKILLPIILIFYIIALMLPRFGKQSPQEIKNYEFKRITRKYASCFQGLLQEYIEKKHVLPRNNQEVYDYFRKSGEKCFYPSGQPDFSIRYLYLKKDLNSNEILNNSSTVAYFIKKISKKSIKFHIYATDMNGKIFFEREGQVSWE